MQRQGESMDGSIGASLKATYRSLLARGLEMGEAANLTAFLHGLASEGFHWTLPEIEAVIQRRIQHVAEIRAAEVAASPRLAGRSRTTIHDRRGSRRGVTHVIDSPTP
jgi:ATP-dependent DNA ligase